MKLFINLPKKAYDTPLGAIKISSFYTFYQKNLQNKKITNIKVDKKTNLIEATKQVFNDNDSLWVALHTNNLINPFVALDESNNIFIKENEVKTTFNPLSSNTGYYNYGITFTAPVGSILTTYVPNTGASWSYSSVGNFDLNGPFSIVEKSESHNKSVTIKPRKNLSGGNDIIVPGTDGNVGEDAFLFINKGITYSLLNNTFVNKNTKKYTETIVSQKNNINTKEIVTVVGTPDDLQPLSGSFFDGSAAESFTTITEFVENKNKILNLVSPSDLSFSMSSFITPKYSA